MPRHLVVCTDGTWNQPDQRDQDRIVPSNVVKMARAVAGKTTDNIPQLVYYDTGVGTGGWWDRIKGGAFGIGLSDNVKQAYTALGQEFRPGDKLFVFGFSRGAYTARSLAGLIGLCGIPDREKSDPAEATGHAFEIYRSKKRHGEAEEHGKKFSRTNKDGTLNNAIHFIGVWDTVGALGIPVGLFRHMGQYRFSFHDTTLGSHITHAYHALAIDERRHPFTPTLWFDKNVAPHQQVEQVWFPGVHSNIGGGYVDAGLSDRAFLWMCLKALHAGLGFKAEYMNLRVAPNYHGELRNSRRSYYKAWPPWTRAIGAVRKDKAAGEAIHYSAKERFEHATETVYRQGHAKKNLGLALKGLRRGSVTEPLYGEKEFYSRLDEKFWNDGGGSPQPFP